MHDTLTIINYEQSFLGIHVTRIYRLVVIENVESDSLFFVFTHIIYSSTIDKY